MIKHYCFVLNEYDDLVREFVTQCVVELMDILPANITLYQPICAAINWLIYIFRLGYVYGRKIDAIEWLWLNSNT